MAQGGKERLKNKLIIRQNLPKQAMINHLIGKKVARMQKKSNRKARQIHIFKIPKCAFYKRI
jgi:hypothetical protein